MSISQIKDTTINGVAIGYHYSISIFPHEWQAPPISAQGEAMQKSEIARSAKVMAISLAKYPTEVLNRNLNSIYFLGLMKFFDVSYGGTNSSTAVYLVNNGKALGYSDKYLEQTFHHEFSSILMRNFQSNFDTTAWKKLNEPGFSYNDPENGVGAIRNNLSSQELDSLLCRKGIPTQYASSSIENDLNTLAQNLFSPDLDFWNYVDRFPRLKQKVRMLINFYSKIDSKFDEAFFRRMKSL
jgi:hypothetical protein